MRRTPRYYFEDLEQGRIFELGSRTVTEADTVSFAREYDPQPFHIDAEAATHSIFGGLIASGWQTGAIYMRMLVDGLLNDTVSEGSPGLDSLRWLRPVRPGDTLRARFTVLEAIASRSRPTIGIIKGLGEVLNQHDELVMTVHSAGFFGRRPT